MTPDEIVESIIEDVYFQKLDELPFAVAHGNKKHAREIVGAMVKVMKRDLHQALTTHTHSIEKKYVEILEGLKIDENANDYGTDYNYALTDAIKAITSTNE